MFYKLFYPDRGQNLAEWIGLAIWTTQATAGKIIICGFEVMKKAASQREAAGETAMSDYLLLFQK